MNVNRNPAERWAAQNERRMDGKSETAATPKPKPNFDAAIKTLNEATTSHRAAYVARAEDIYMEGLRNMRATLATNGMDLNKVAPYPDSFRTGRKEYRMQKAVHDRYKGSFEDADDRPMSYTGRLNGKEPWLVKEKADAEAKVRAEARQDANACFDSYLFKLAGKIARPLKSATLVGVLWDGSTLTVECEDGETQTWNTKCIINQSVYGKLFNQWPTRRTA